MASRRCFSWSVTPRSAPPRSRPARPRASRNRLTFSVCPARPAPARTPGTRSCCTNSTTVIARATSLRYCRGSTSICAARRRKARRRSAFVSLLKRTKVRAARRMVIQNPLPDRADHAAIDAQGGAGRGGGLLRADIDDHVGHLFRRRQPPQDRRWPVFGDELLLHLALREAGVLRHFAEKV